MRKHEYAKVRNRIEKSLTRDSTPKNKEFCYGFLVALADYEIISEKIYTDLRYMVREWNQ